MKESTSRETQVIQERHWRTETQPKECAVNGTWRDESDGDAVRLFFNLILKKIVEHDAIFFEKLFFDLLI